MNKSLYTVVALATVFAGAGLLSPSTVTAQDNILAEMYGRGVHAFYAGRYSEADQHLTTAIDGGITDPRAYYFRGIVAHSQGRQMEAEADWKEGAKMEASSTMNLHVGRALSRFQGSARLKLEAIRQAARINALSGVTTRTDIRMREIKAAESPLAGGVTRPRVPLSSNPITLPPPPAGGASPFASDASLAGGQPKIENDDALADAMNDPFKDDPAGPAAVGPDPGAAAPAGDPFGGAAAPAADPFGGGADPAADPFGGGAADTSGGDTMADPFGADPFGN